MHLYVIIERYLLSVPTGSITCYTEPSVAGEFNCRASTNNFYATIEECCVERNGHFFQGVGDASCQACIGMERNIYQKCLSCVYIQLYHVAK